MRGGGAVTSKLTSSIIIIAKTSLSPGSFVVALFMVGHGLYIPCCVFVAMPLAPPLCPKLGGN